MTKLTLDEVKRILLESLPNADSIQINDISGLDDGFIRIVGIYLTPAHRIQKEKDK